MKNTEVANHIGGWVEVVNSPWEKHKGYKAKVIRPAFNSRTQEFLGWKIDIKGLGQEWIYQSTDLEKV